MTNWLNSAGGPLICLDSKLISLWMGLRGLSSDDHRFSKHDYDRACTSKDYLSLISVSDGAGIVLGDEPLQSTFLTNDGNLWIVRWIQAPTNFDVPELFGQIEGYLQKLQESVIYEVGFHPIKLFDSALEGAKVGEKSLSCECSPGRYQVTSEIYNRQQSKFLIHRFFKT